LQSKNRSVSRSIRFYTDPKGKQIKGEGRQQKSIKINISEWVIPFSLILSGQTYIARGLAAILNATTPLFTVIAAHLWTRDENFSVNKLNSSTSLEWGSSV
jgi:hypothetical protein